ncbi:MAG: RNA polymerase sigma factor RpoD/SigA [bacterium]
MRKLKITRSITNHDCPSTEKYLSDISKIPRVTPDDETRLTQLIRKGDKKALDTLVQANLRFVVSVAKRYQHQGMTFGDLINEGNIGLITAAQRFDETRGFKFISFAVWWIRQSILQALAEGSRMVRLPHNRILVHNKARRLANKFEQDNERDPSDEELAELTGMTEIEITRYYQGDAFHTSLDSPMSADSDNETTMGDMLADEGSADDRIMRKSLQAEVRELLKSWTPKDRDVIIAYFRLDGEYGLDVEDVMKKYGLTREGVQRIKERLVRKRFRKPQYRQKLKPYLG